MMTTDSLNILMLEDSASDAEMIQRTIKKAGFNCRFNVMMTREPYETALNDCIPDIIISDNAMPQFSAGEALSILRKNSPHIPFILVTGTVSEEFAAGIIKDGADDYLLKDRLARLPAAIDAALHKRKAERAQGRAVEALRESEEKYRDIVENITDILCLHDMEGKVYSVNEAARHQLGYEVEDMLKMNIRDILTAQSKERFEEYIQLIKTTGCFKGLLTVQTKTGDLRIWEVNNSLKTGDGAKDMVRGFARDVTERIAAEKKLAFSEKRFRALIEHSGDAVTLLDESLRILYRSPAAPAVTGWDNEETKDTSATANIHPDDMAKFKIDFARALNNPGIAVPYCTRYCRRDGHYFWYEGTFTNMLHIKEVNAVVANYRDITKRKLAEEKLSSSERRYRNTLDNMLEGVQIIGYDWRYIYVNDALARHAKYPKEELLGSTVMEKISRHRRKQKYLNFTGNVLMSGFLYKQKMNLNFLIKQKAGLSSVFSRYRKVFLYSL